MRREDDEYYVIPRPYHIPVDEKLHTDEHPFCWDDTCGCHEDPLLINDVAQQYQDGLLTPQEATRTVEGKTL